MRFVNISIGTKDSHMMNGAADSLRRQGLDFGFRCYDSMDLDEDGDLLQDAVDYLSGADMVSMRVHGDTSYFKKFDLVMKAVSRRKASVILHCTEDVVTESFRYLFDGTDEEYSRLLSYLELEGDDNYESLLRWALNRYAGTHLDVPDPVRPPAQGLYYPGRESIDIPSFVAGLDRGRPSVGIFFHQQQWLNRNLAHVDALIREVEALGANAVPVFMFSIESGVTGAKGMKRILREDLTVGGEPVLDSILMTLSFSQILVVSPGDGEQVSDDNFFLDYGVPVIQTPMVSRSAEKWRGDDGGLSPGEIAYCIAHPEFDGQIISAANCSMEREGDGSFVCSPLEDRPARVAETAVNWACLRYRPDSERKVAILLYMYPPKTADAGGASGLDTFASVIDLLGRMADAGYRLGDDMPRTPEELVDRMLSGLTNDTSWLGDDAVRDRSADFVSSDTYDRWFSALRGDAAERLEQDWGKPPGDFMTVGGDIAVPGILLGNVFVGFQPDRGRNAQEDYHNPFVVMPHQYLAYYRWLKEVFGADAVVHVGTHGTLEWLPGKGVALSGSCCPDYVLDSVPNIYPYIVSNPGEGIEAKRRSEAVIVDHMVPAMTRAGGYDDLLELEGIVQNYMNAKAIGQTDKLELIRVKLRETVGRMDYYRDLKLSPDCTDAEFDSRVDDLYDYLTEVKENLIKDGLHILGKVPEGRRMEECVYSLMRLPNGDVPSMRASVAACMGYDIRDLQDDPSSYDGRSGMLKGQVLDGVEERTERLISDMASVGFSTAECMGIVDRDFPEDPGELAESVRYACGRLVPDLRGTSAELDSVMDALRGRYVRPGPSGCPTRGRAQILPTGRNFYSIDPEAVPWQSSWEVGKEMADQMLERYVREHGTYPKEVGIVVWATDTMRTGGDDIGYILWLMGLRPVWTGYAGRVKGLEVIPLEELGRPRVDVTLRISGLFRDTFPNLVELIDGGVRTVASLDESDGENFLRANLREDIVQSIAEGVPEDEARENAMVRIFGDAPGTYGSGTNILIGTSDWKELGDLASIYESYAHYAYGGGRKGRAMPEAFRRRLMNMEVTVKNSTSREYDMIDNDDVYNDLGGFNAAVRAVSGRMPMSVIGCSADTANLKLKTIDEECRYIFRSKIMNPKWVDGLKEHGFKGAQEICDMAEFVLGWDATSDIIEPWMYQTIADRFLLDGDNSEWLREANPYAMYETAATLLEVVGRGMWDPDDATREALERIYTELEGDFEEAGDRPSGKAGI